MNDTKDLVERARACALCHVGNGNSDVNHDLIAAGHPRLNFEFAGFHALMPKHWDEAPQKQKYPDLEARLWVIGQLTSAKAALELLAYRADDKKLAPPGLGKAWPEFAEYQCYACHHDIQADSWRTKQYQPKKDGNASFGTLPWGSWYYPLLSQVPGVPADAVTALPGLQDEMRKPLPDREAIMKQAHALAHNLESWALRAAKAKALDGTALHKQFGAIAREEKLAETWDGAAQVYLALAALYHAQNDLGPRASGPGIRTQLKTMREKLEFPLKYDSPVESKFRDDRDDFLKALKAINQLDK
jgi:hypothetical protein